MWSPWRAHRRRWSRSGNQGGTSSSGTAYTHHDIPIPFSTPPLHVELLTWFLFWKAGGALAGLIVGTAVGAAVFHEKVDTHDDSSNTSGSKVTISTTKGTHAPVFMCSDNTASAFVDAMQ